jgi:hypothetical protein
MFIDAHIPLGGCIGGAFQACIESMALFVLVDIKGNHISHTLKLPSLHARTAHLVNVKILRN